MRHIICVIHWEKRDLLWTWSHLRVYRVQLHRYMRGVVRMVTKCCYREVILALSRENLVSVLVCRCNLCILSKAPTSCVVLYRNTLKALHVQFKQMSSSPVSLFRDSTKVSSDPPLQFRQCCIQLDSACVWHKFTLDIKW